MNSVDLPAILALMIHLDALFTFLLNSGTSDMQVVKRMYFEMSPAAHTTETLQLRAAAHRCSQ